MNKSKIAIVLPPRERDLGGLVVQRILPAVGRKMVGPFVFLDRMGPSTFAAHTGLDVRPHPHIGLATVTFLFEGAIFHRDSLGSEQVIRPGDVNWMIAGSGIVHSERTPTDLRQTGGRLDGLQCWIALPKEQEDRQPAFFHHPARSLPSFTVEGVSLRLLAGDLFERRSPVQTISDTLYVDAHMPKGSRLTIPAGRRELGVYVATGKIRVEGETPPAQSLTVGNPGESLIVDADTDARVLVIGGEPFGETREIWWNFVASSKERIEHAKVAWREGRFPSVPGDDREFIPLPE